MSNLQCPLYDRIMQFEFGSEDDEFSFSDRLCRENLWSEEYTELCIKEYKKFLYLAMISEREVTPSDQVDQVWHLHLLYTKSYWFELCQNVLKTSLHHIPTKGGAAELERFREQYRYTLKKYGETFDEPPPTEFWPDIDSRFKSTDKFIQVNSDDFKPYKNPLSILPVFVLLLIAYSLDNIAVANMIVGYVTFRIVEWILKPRLSGRSSTSKGCGGGGCGGGCGGG